MVSPKVEYITSEYNIVSVPCSITLQTGGGIPRSLIITHSQLCSSCNGLTLQFEEQPPQRVVLYNSESVIIPLTGVLYQSNLWFDILSTNGGHIIFTVEVLKIN